MTVADVTRDGLWGLPAPDLLKKVKKDAWDEKFNRTLQEIAWETASNYSFSGIKAEKDK